MSISKNLKLLEQGQQIRCCGGTHSLLGQMYCLWRPFFPTGRKRGILSQKTMLTDAYKSH